MSVVSTRCGPSPQLCWTNSAKNVYTIVACSYSTLYLPIAVCRQFGKTIRLELLRSLWFVWKQCHPTLLFTLTELFWRWKFLLVLLPKILVDVPNRNTNVYWKQTQTKTKNGRRERLFFFRYRFSSESFTTRVYPALARILYLLLPLFSRHGGFIVFFFHIAREFRHPLIRNCSKLMRLPFFFVLFYFLYEFDRVRALRSGIRWNGTR